MSIPIKTPEEIDCMRVSCRAAREILEEVSRAVVPGVSTGEIDKLAARLIAKKGGRKPLPPLPRISRQHLHLGQRRGRPRHRRVPPHPVRRHREARHRHHPARLGRRTPRPPSPSGPSRLRSPPARQDAGGAGRRHRASARGQPRLRHLPGHRKLRRLQRLQRRPRIPSATASAHAA